MKYVETDRCQLCGSWFGSNYEEEHAYHNSYCSIKCRYSFSREKISFSHRGYVFFSDIKKNETDIFINKTFVKQATISRFINPNLVSEDDLDKIMLLI
jgi:hypothetical protein